MTGYAVIVHGMEIESRTTYITKLLTHYKQLSIESYRGQAAQGRVVQSHESGDLCWTGWMLEFGRIFKDLNTRAPPI